MSSSLMRARKGEYALVCSGLFFMAMLAALAACCIQQQVSTGEKKDPIKSQIEVRGPTAVHEAAHAVASVVLQPERRLSSVYVAAQRPADDRYLGVVYYVNPDDCDGPDRAECLRRRAVVDLVGEASEQVLRNTQPPNEYDDKYYAQQKLLARCQIEGACQPCPPEKRVGGRICPLDIQIEIEREAAFKEATEFVQDHCLAIQLFANRILEEPLVNDRHTIDGPAAEAFIKDAVAKSEKGACRPPAPEPPVDAGAAPDATSAPSSLSPMEVKPFWP